MSFPPTPHEIALVLMIAGVASLVLRHPLAKLDQLLVKGGPFATEQRRLFISRHMVIGTGVSLIALALALVVFR